MPHRFAAWPAVAVILLALAQAAPAQTAAGKDAGQAKKAEPAEVVKTTHKLRVGGQELAYTALAGTLALKDDKDKATASVFFVAYLLDGAAAKDRPITFAFNGGPGSSAVWLHLGVLGPKRVLLHDNGTPAAPPYRLVDNPHTLLDRTDLVFIDPVSTGFSRPAEGKDGKDFHGVQQDLESVGEFVRLFLTRHGRWESPKFLCGESYGTTRAAGLAEHLQGRHGINLNGIMLVSAVLNFQTIRFDEGNDLPYVLFLPSYAATAWYHKALAPDLQAADLRTVAAKARQFAAGEYNLALFQGSDLPEGQRKRTAEQVARLTGLSPEYVLNNNLRVPPHRFMRELLRDRRRTVGRFDSRLTGRDGDAAGETPEYDPSYAAVQGPYTAAVNAYLRNELKYENDRVYEILTGKVQPWDYGSAKNRYLNLSRELRSALTKNPYLKVFVANGYYDLATPFFASEYTFNHLGIDPSLAGNVEMGYYEAGHMMYTHLPSLQRLDQDLDRFIDAAVAR